MAQLKSRVDLNTAEFPLLAEWAGRTVMQAGADIQSQALVTTPQIIYCENVLPTQQGCKSVSYKDLVAATTNNLFSNIFTVADTSQNKALIGVTTDSHIFMLTSAAPTWVDVTPAGWAGGDKVTTGSANGNHYLYLQNKGCYLVNIIGITLTLTTLTGITAANILGMTGAVNYLLLWDNTNMYWSSTVNPLDFVPSLITGAGTITPNDLKGKIVICVPLNNGFVIYTDTNAVIASFSNNTQFPWIFRNANNAAGIATYKQVSPAAGISFHIVLSTAGVTQITPQGGEIITPEVSDFLAARDMEAFDYINNVIEDIDLEGIVPVTAAITVLGARYVVVSYGATSYTDALVYDLNLKRWGKLHLPHVCCFEIKVNLEGAHVSYISLLGTTYAARSPATYGSSSVTLNNPPIVGRLFGFLLADGSIKVAWLDYGSTNDTAVLVLGKYQAVRNYLLDLQEIEVEGVHVNNGSFSLIDIPTLDGRTELASITPTLLETQENFRRYALNREAKNHTLIFKGAFNLTTVEITGKLGARR